MSLRASQDSNRVKIDFLCYNTYYHKYKPMLCKVTYESKHKLIKLISRTFKEIMVLTKEILPQYITRYFLYYIDKDGDEISLLNQSDFSIFLETNQQNIHVYVKEEQILETLSNASCSQQQDSLSIDKISDAGLNSKHSSILKGLGNNFSVHSYHQEQKNSHIEKSTGNTKYSDKPQQQSILNFSSRRQQTHNAICNSCKNKQIIGYRYQCPFCINFNLCEICQKIQKHKHPLLQIKRSGQEIIHSQLRDHLNLEIPSKQYMQISNQLEQQKKINLNLLKLIEEIDKNEEESKINKEGVFKKSLFDEKFFKDQQNHFKGSIEQRRKRRQEIFDSFFEKPLIEQNSRFLNRPRFSYAQPASSFTRSNRTTNYFDNF